jgi:hypothetical protein
MEEDDPIMANYLAKVRKYKEKKWAEDRGRFNASANEKFLGFTRGRA